MSLTTAEQPWSADRINVFISALASCILASTALRVMHFDVRLKVGVKRAARRLRAYGDYHK